MIPKLELGSYAPRGLHMGHLGVKGNRYAVILDRRFDLLEDYQEPKTWLAQETTNAGRVIGPAVRVSVDHEATGTGTSGTGDTTLRRC